MNEKELQKHRFIHFCKRIKEEKSPHLTRLMLAVKRNRNYIRPIIATEQARQEVATSQALFVGSLEVGENVHIINKKYPNIIVGEVSYIGKTTFKIKNDNRFYQLSEIITIG